MYPILQAYTLGEFSGFIGNGMVQALGGSSLFIGVAVLLAIAFMAWRLNLHITVTFGMAFIALSFLKTYFEDVGTSDIGIFGVLYNLMILGMALVFLMVINDTRK